MKINESLAIEKMNSNDIYLMKEGIMWLAYERSAYRLMKYLPTLHPVKRHRTETKTDVCFIRFPFNRLASMLSLIKNTTLLIKEQSTEKIAIAVVEPQDSNEQSAFNAWKEQLVIPSLPPVKNINPAVKDAEKNILQKIKQYPVLKKTPLETMQFVAEMQVLLNQH